MKLITLTCPKSGAQMEVNPELEAIICNYCGNKMLIDREVVEQKITGGFEFGYQQEQGRLKAQQEEQQKRIREEDKEARKNAYAATEWVTFENKYMRHDIGKAFDDVEA